MNSNNIDLFDALGIGTREDSYTTLLSVLFNKRGEQERAKQFFRKVVETEPPAGPIRVESQLQLRQQGDRGADIPDLIFAFGNYAVSILVVEAKIKSGENSDQLKRYGSEEGRRKILKALKLEDHEPDKVRWHYLYMTLECEKPAKLGNFCPISWEPVRDSLPTNQAFAPELFPAYSCLHERLNSYYRVRDKILERGELSDDTVLEDYLNETYGLVDRTNRFHWLTEHIAKTLPGLQTTFGKAQGRGFANPMVQIRRSSWQSKKYGENGNRLRECFDIHLELQLEDQKDVKFVLHYETNPYIPGINEISDIPEKQRKKYWELRKEFAETLNHHKQLKITDWKLTIPQGWKHPPPKSSNQLAKFENFGLTRSVGEFREWLQRGSKVMVSVVDDAGRKNHLW